jgi:hypothetical protein
VAQASPLPDTITVGATTLSHIELNGVLSAELTVAPGEVVKIRAGWEDNNPCTTCDDNVATAFAGNPHAGCLESRGPNEKTGGGEVNLGAAPQAPGTYNVVALFEQTFFCGQAWNTSESTGYQVIAKITVPFPVPTGKGQCMNGGWRKLADRKGKTFINQGECVSYVAS